MRTFCLVSALCLVHVRSHVDPHRMLAREVHVFTHRAYRVDPAPNQEDKDDGGEGRDVDTGIESIFVFSDRVEVVENVCTMFCEFHLENAARMLIDQQSSILGGLAVPQITVRPLERSESKQLYGKAAAQKEALRVTVDIGSELLPGTLTMGLVHDGGTGGTKIWDAALFLARWLVQEEQEWRSRSGKAGRVHGEAAFSPFNQSNLVVCELVWVSRLSLQRPLRRKYMSPTS